MAFINRALDPVLKRFSKFPVVALLGPRQSGKTTLAKHTFSQHIYVNLEDLELRSIALNDPKAFLRRYENEHGIILDEFQNCPDLLSYIQVIADEKDRPGYFILTGSQNFLMNQAISQSLAGRVGILTLLPLSLQELAAHKLLSANHPEETIYNGGYPRLYQDYTPQEIYPSYIQTYVERDVRQLINVANLNTFQKFIKLCAARVGQLLNYSDLAVSCGISVPTVHSWLAILEASYIIFLLRPHSINFNKLVVKTPKLYFYDTGLLCSLLEIDSPQSLMFNPYYGNLFECLIISDLYKQFFNQGMPAPLFFWRDKNGTIEVDCIVDQNAQLTPLEIKSGETYTPHYFDSLLKWAKAGMQADSKHGFVESRLLQHGYVIYGGAQSFASNQGNLVPWYEAGDLITTIKKRR